MEISVEAAPSVLYDAVAIPNGADSTACLLKNGQVIEFIKDQYRHCKPILAMGTSGALIEKAGIPQALPSGDADPALLGMSGETGKNAFADFISAIQQHKVVERETDPPRI